MVSTKLVEGLLESAMIGIGILFVVVGYANYYSVAPDGCSFVSCGPPHYELQYRVAFFAGLVIVAVGAIGLAWNFIARGRKKSL